MVRTLLLLLCLSAGRAERVTVGATGQTSQADVIKRSLRGGCADLRDDCAELAGPLLHGCGSQVGVMLLECPRTCEACSYKGLIDEALECKDTNPECDNWARMGECEANPRFMLQSCSIACGSCEAKQSGCNRRNSTLPMPAPGGLQAMFERSLTDFPQYEPVALSRDPWVVQFENLVTAEEAAAMIAACPNFERSMAGDQLSPVRTSTQCWCDEKAGCMNNTIVHGLTERILTVTGLPYNNAEYFQVLRYEAGQFYKQHHDQQSGHWTPQGVRLYTFFVCETPPRTEPIGVLPQERTRRAQ